MGGHINTVFSLTTIMFTVCVILSITTFQEVPLKMLNKVEMQYRDVSCFKINKYLYLLANECRVFFKYLLTYLLGYILRIFLALRQTRVRKLE